MSESRAAQLAREEAERVDAEHPDVPDAPETPQEPPTPGTAPEPPEQPDGPEQPVQEPQASLSPEQIEARMKAWERERDRHFRELEKRDDYRYAASAVCPLCEGYGMILPELPEPENTARRVAVSMALGGDGEPEYREAPDREQCPDCDGWGEVLTGSRRRENQTGQCFRCNGTGFISKQGEIKPLFTPAPAPAPAQPFGNGTPAAPPTDSWGRPIGHPHFGTPPAQVGV